MKFQQVDPEPMIRDNNQFLHTRQAGVEVPLGQSIVTAVIFGLTVFILMLIVDVMDPWKHGLIAFVLGLVGMWMLSITRWLNLTKEHRVQVAEVDHDNNPATPRIVRVQIDKVEDGQVRQWKMFDLPATDEQMAVLASGLLDGSRPFSEREWAGAGRPFSSNEFRDLRTELIKRGLIALKSEKDQRQGYVLTDDGKAVFEQFLE